MKTKESVCLWKNAKNGAAAHAVGTLIGHQPAGNTSIASERTAQRVSEAFDQSEQRLDDRVLLRRFVQDADEAAFEEIVKRYQKLVMSICGRILGSGQDAEDAFQATFICLARRPRSIRHSKALSSWLYTVAYRTSWRLIRQRNNAPTENLETELMSQSTDPLDEISDAQDCVIVDEELNRLPVKFKDVLVMTYFADQSSQQIADSLNVSKGTVDGRIRDARNMLRVKLARRGVTIGAIALAASACTQATAAVSPTVLNSTLLLGSQTLANHTLSTPDFSRINHLIRPETTMLSTKMIAATMLGIATVGAIGLNGIVSAQQGGNSTSNANSINAIADANGRGQTKGYSSSTIVSVSPNVTDDPFGSDESEQKSDPLADAMRRVDQAAVDPFGSATGDRKTTNSSTLGPKKIYSSTPGDASPIERRIYAAMEAPITLDFPGQTSLGEVLGAIVNSINRPNAQGKITMMIDHIALDSEGLNSLDDILVKDIILEDIGLKKALTLILDQTNIDYLIREDVLFLTSKAEASSNEDYFSTRIYPVKNLLALNVTPSEAGYGGGMMGMGMEGDYGGGSPDVGEMGMGGLNALPAQMGGDMGMGGGMGGGMGLGDDYGGYVPQPRKPLIQLVCDMTSPPCQWVDRDGQGGAISIAGNSLVVRQSRKGHDEIVKLLNLLANAKE